MRIHERRHNVLIQNNEIPKCTHEEMGYKLDQFLKLFQVMNCEFVSLRIIDPNEEDLNLTKNSISALEAIWREMSLSITPNAHIIFVHAFHYRKFLVVSQIDTRTRLSNHIKRS